MTAWTPKPEKVNIWTLQYNVLYLLTESNENLLDETGDLILLNQGGVGAYTNEVNTLKVWTDKGLPVSGWNKQPVPTDIWI